MPATPRPHASISPARKKALAMSGLCGRDACGVVPHLTPPDKRGGAVPGFLEAGYLSFVSKVAGGGVPCAARGETETCTTPRRNYYECSHRTLMSYWIP